MSKKDEWQKLIDARKVAEYWMKRYIQAENRLEQYEWVSVKDRLPDNANGVIVCDEFGFVYPACYYTFDKCWMYSFTDERCGHKITHWMPLPEKPESEDDEDV